MTDGSILLISDLHTRYFVINEQIRHAEESSAGAIDSVLVLGDFGFFGEEMHEYFRRGANRFLKPVSCIEGNHEDHGELTNLADRFADVVTYLPRGSICELGTQRGLCLGGARYMDAWSTPRGCEITDADLDACLAHAPGAVDIMLSHDCPADIGMPNTPGLEYYGKPGVPEMARLADHFAPRLWFFGHHHRWFDLQREGTRYIGLPQSWSGYALLHPDGEVDLVRNEVATGSRSRWRRWLGLK